MPKFTNSSHKSKAGALKAMLMIVLATATLGIGQAWAAGGLVFTGKNGTQNGLNSCKIDVSFNLTYNRNVSGGFDLYQYNIIGVMPDGTERNYTRAAMDPYFAQDFEWDWLQGTESFTKSLTIPTRSETPTSLKFSVYNGSNQGGSVGPLLGSEDLLSLCTFTLPNTKPIAEAGPDQTGLSGGDLVVLDGTGSSDGDGDTITYLWTQVSGPTVTLSDETSATPSFTFPSSGTKGTIVFELVVRDQEENSLADQVRILPVNERPIAEAGADQLNLAPGTYVTLDGSGSSDPDGDPLTYQWRRNFINTSLEFTSVSPSFYIPSGETRNYLLVVNDGVEDSVVDTVTVSAESTGMIEIDIAYNHLGSNGFDPVTCLYNPSLISYSVKTKGVTDDGDGKDYWLIEWYDYDGLLVGTNQGAAPIGTASASMASVASGSINASNISTVFWSNPHTYVIYDTDMNYNKLGPKTEVRPGARVANFPVGDIAWKKCWDGLGNTAPIANAGPDQTMTTIGTTVTLDGTGSTDDDGDSLTYQWTQISGPTVTLSDASSAMPTFIVPVGADITPIIFSLVVNDGTVDSSADEITVQAVAANTAPVADAGADQTTLRPNDTVTLDGSGSSDADSDTLTYMWTQVSGPAVTLSDATAVNPTFTIPLDAVATAIVFELVVNDGTVDSAPDEVTLQAVNDVPVANAGPDQTDPRPNDVVTLDGTASSDPDGDSLTYMWTQVSGPAVTLDDATSATPTFTIPLDAVDTAIVFELVVNDGFVDSAVDQVMIMAQNEAPVADAGEDQDDPRPNSVVTLDGSGSSDPDGDNLTYLWTQVSGPVVTLDDPTAMSPTFTIPVEAVTTPIIFQLVVNDGFVDSAPDTVTIMAQNEAPVAEAGVDQNDVIPGNTIDLDGTGSSDADGDPLTYMWTQVSGTPVTLNDPTSATPTFEAPGGGGSLVFQLVVNDGFVDSAPDTVTITVQDNVAVTTKAIGDFLTARNALILSHQPDLQRRLDRLQGRGGSRNVSSVNGIPVPGTQNLPVQLAMNGSNTQLSGSLSGLKNTDGKRKVSEPGSFDIWGEAYISSFNIDQRSGDFGIYYLGGDYLVNENLLVGVLGQLDRIDYDDNFQIGVLDGEGWMAGPYVTARLSDNLYADGRITYGRSDNTIAPFGTYVDSFETSRYLFAGSLTGEFDLSEKFTLRPEGGITYLSEEQDSYVDALGSTIPSQSSEQGQFNLGPRLHYNYVSDSGFSFRPFFEVEGIYSFGDGVDIVIGDDTRLRLEGGADIFTGGGFRFSGSYFKDGIGADNFDADGFRITGGFTF